MLTYCITVDLGKIV